MVENLNIGVQRGGQRRKGGMTIQDTREKEGERKTPETLLLQASLKIQNQQPQQPCDK